MAASLASIRALSVARRDSVLLLKFSQKCRLSSSSSQSSEDKVKPPSFLKRLMVDRVIGMVNDSTSRLEKAYPTVFQIYKTFKTGLSGFVQESRDYYRASTEVWSGCSLRDLSRKDLEILRFLPKDFGKIIPVLLMTLVPGGSGAFPLAYVFPRLLLSHHFWTEQQRHEFWQRDLKHRLQHLYPILDHMALMSQYITDPDMETRIIKIVKKLQHSVHPTVTDILEVKPLFENYPYNLERLNVAYARHLAKLMRMSVRRKRLRHDAMLLHYTDMAMMREGVETMTDFELERACFWRGMNPVGVKRRDRIVYLRQWLDISKTVDEENVSLLLHLPLLFGFNLPTNRELMGGWLSRFRKHQSSGSSASS